MPELQIMFIKFSGAVLKIKWLICLILLVKLSKEVISRIGNHELVIICRDKTEITMG